MIPSTAVKEAITYSEYVSLIKKNLEEGKSTGIVQSEEYLEYSKINLQRMQRLDKTIVLAEDFKKTLDQISGNYLLLTLTEGWCGDAAQLVPLFACIEKYHPQLKLRILLRDEHPEIMKQYLTNGSRSIPKIICVDEKTLSEKFNWGPRPEALQSQVIPLIRSGATKADKSLFIQKWYNTDKTLSSQKELVALFHKLQ
jgi:hypothetical protein